MPKTVTNLLWAGLCLLAILLAWSVLNGPAQPASAAQTTPFPTPTPGPDGRIIYVVQKNDSWWRIAAIYSLNLDELLALNNATRDTILVEGKELLLGLGGPAQVTPTFGPSPTSLPVLPTATAQPGSGTLCILVFNDRNGDSTRQEEELSIPEGAISVTDRSGRVSLTGTTTSGLEPYCFPELPEGDYNVSIAVPEGYNATTILNYALRMEPGAETYLDFGAQLNSVALAETPTPTAGTKSLLLGILGGLLIMGGLVLGILAGRLAKKKGGGERGG